ncbi:hypothetical protein SAE02_53350 [Skermanella aerolata]|uniref:Uncharacterized protein n=1 Tax=Skermanella aerolata TaxID=393310 RepID=A0A512DXI2_9PROT|nr:hypothetical protein SAE02_53350 [Skermanella aerolata]
MKTGSNYWPVLYVGTFGFSKTSSDPLTSNLSEEIMLLVQTDGRNDCPRQAGAWKRPRQGPAEMIVRTAMVAR